MKFNIVSIRKQLHLIKSSLILAKENTIFLKKLSAKFNINFIRKNSFFFIQ